MATDAALVVAVGGGLASIGVMAVVNRYRVRKLEGWAWGGDQGEGREQRTESMGEQMDRIERKLDDERQERRADHDEVRSEIELNRRLSVETVTAVVDVLDKELEADVATEDVRPDWYEYVMDDEDPEFDGGQPPAGD